MLQDVRHSSYVTFISHRSLIFHISSIIWLKSVYISSIVQSHSVILTSLSLSLIFVKISFISFQLTLMFRTIKCIFYELFFFPIFSLTVVNFELTVVVSVRVVKITNWILINYCTRISPKNFLINLKNDQIYKLWLIGTQIMKATSNKSTRW